MSSKPVLEICVYNVRSCLIAEQAGAARVELCADPGNGGTTPSYGTLRTARAKTTIALFPIIRPRGGDFFYTQDEWETIMLDIRLAKELGCEGISTGCARRDGSIDADGLQRIVDLAYPMEVTCHRVFDATPDKFEALETIVAAGCQRILTSGGAATAEQGLPLLRQLVEKAAGRISIMPGAGIRSGNAARIKAESGAGEFHSSARFTGNGGPDAGNSVLDFGTIYEADPAEVAAMLSALA